MTINQKHQQEITKIKELINLSRKDSKLTVEEVRDILIKVLRKIYEEDPNTIVGYVAGSITSDGPDFVEENIEKLAKYAEYLRNKYSPHIFSTKEIFTKEDQNEITSQGEQAQVELRMFWRDIQTSGYITDLFMIPGWENSVGARDEHDAAKESGKIRIHYVDDLGY